MLSAVGITKRFAGTTAVNGLHLTLRQGEIIGLLGPNGSGKTTSLRMLLGIIDPDAGIILHHGRERGPDFKQLTGYLPEERGVYKQVTARATIRFFAKLKGMSDIQIESNMRVLAKELEMEDLLARKTFELSKGNQQKVQLLISMVNNPSLLFLDEPHSGLDPENQKLLQQLLARQKEDGKLILVSTHHLELAEAICDHVVLLSEGKAILTGKPEEITRAKERGLYHLITTTPLPNGFTCRAAIAIYGEAGIYRVTLREDATAGDFVRQLPDGIGLSEIRPATFSLRDAYHAAMETPGRA